jgi:hypothetical protein
MTKKKNEKTGVQEWAEKSVNLQYGCENNCRYCYAKKMAGRFGRIPPEGWDYPILKTTRPSIPSNSKVMFPSTHDLTENNIDVAIQCINILHSKKNKILIVTKPRLKCIKQIVENEMRHPMEDRVEFRFTIGAWTDETQQLWEPNAPSIDERCDCLRYLKDYNFKISISMEPLLETDPLAILTMISCLKGYPITEIWIGAMNYVKNAPKLDYLAIYNRYKDDPKIKWKDSFRKKLPICLLCGQPLDPPHLRTYVNGKIQWVHDACYQKAIWEGHAL